MYYRLHLLIIVAIILHIVPTGVLAQTPAHAPILLPTVTPTPKTPTPNARTMIVLNTANLRAGPGTTFAVVGSAQPGDKLKVVGANADGDWYQLDTGTWIAAFLVELPGAATAPTWTPTPGPALAQDATTPAVQLVILGPIERQYMNDLTKIMGSYGAAFKVLTEQNTKAGKDLTLMFDRDWRTTTLAALQYVKNLDAQARALTPPPLFKAMHDDVLQAAAHYDKASDLASTGLNQFDFDLFEAASNETNLGNDALYEALAKLKAIKAQAGN